MRYAPANWVVLHVYKDEKNVLRYRKNGLVPQTSWHKPLPYADDFNEDQFLWRNYLATNKFIVNTKLHGEVIASATADPDAHEARIPLNDKSIDTCNMDIALLDARYKHGGQLEITRKQIIVQLFHKLHESGKFNNVKEVTEEIAARVCAEPKHIATTLKNLKLINTTRNITGEAYTISKQSPEYRCLQRAVSKARSRAFVSNIPGSFKIDDLLINHSDLTASVPIICPVLRLKLNLEDDRTHLAMAVWRKDTRSPLSKTNVAVMSRLASRMIEGTAAQATITTYLATNPDAAASWKQWSINNE